VQRLRHLVKRKWVLYLLAVAVGVWGARPMLVEGLSPPDASTFPDCDVPMLKRGADQAPRLRDTHVWWHGNWICLNPFWRPLSSYGFWIMFRTLGFEHHDRFQVVAALGHVAVTVLLLAFTLELTRRRYLALLAVLLHNVRRLPWPVSLWMASVGIGALDHWKSVPDVWLALWVLPALMMAWRGSGWWATVFAALAAMTKETGFVAFPLVAVFYWWRWRRLHRFMWALGGIALVLTAVKLIFVGPGWVLGSNRSMWLRIARFVGPEPINIFTTGFAPWALIGVAIAMTVVLRRRRWLRALAVPVAVVLGAALFQILNRPEHALGGAVALAALLEPRFLLGSTMNVATWLVLAWAGLGGRDRSLIVLLALGFLALGLPATFAPQTGMRSFYTAWLLSTTVKALCLWSLPAAFGLSWPTRMSARDPHVAVTQT